jgi:hypothetical protein
MESHGFHLPRPAAASGAAATRRDREDDSRAFNLSLHDSRHMRGGADPA